MHVHAGHLRPGGGDGGHAIGLAPQVPDSMHSQAVSQPASATACDIDQQPRQPLWHVCGRDCMALLSLGCIVIHPTSHSGSASMSMW